MNTLSHTPEQLQEISALEAKYGFPSLMVAGVDPEIAAKLTPFQRQHVNNCLFIANQRFGEELKSQLGRQSTVEELANRLSLSMAINRRNTPAPIPSVTQ